MSKPAVGDKGFFQTGRYTFEPVTVVATNVDLVYIRTNSLQPVLFGIETMQTTMWIPWEQFLTAEQACAVVKREYYGIDYKKP